MSPTPSADEPHARKLQSAMLDHSGLAIERLPGLAYALEQFARAAPNALANLVGGPVVAAIDEIRATTLFQSLADCEGLPAAILIAPSLDAQIAIVLDEHIVDILVPVVFGAVESAAPAQPGEGAKGRAQTAIETALVEEFVRALGRGLEAAFAQMGMIAFEFQRVAKLVDVFALGRREMPAAAARVSLKTSAGACDCIVVLPQTFILPLRGQLAVDPSEQIASNDKRWAAQIEAGVTRAHLRVNAILDEVDMSLRDVAALEIGQIIALSGAGVGRVRLECSGRGIFWCKLNESDGRYLLEIEGAAEPGESAERAPHFATT